MRFLFAVPVVAFMLAACGGEEADLTVYSGRHEELVTGLIEQFEEETGLEVEARFGDSAELAATISEEGENSPADVFFAQDAGSLGAVAEEGLLGELPPRVLGSVPQRFRDPQGRWVGTSGRARVIAFNTEVLSEEELPDSILEYANRHWRGRIGLAPTNASFQAMVSSMRMSLGDERTRDWLEAIAANDPLLSENNIQTVEAIAAGEIDVGFVNHYYLYEVLREQPNAPVANHFMTEGDPGALVNVAGAAILASSDDRADAERFVAYLLREGQPYFARETAEYPLVEGVEPGPDLPPLESVHSVDLDLGELGPELRATLEMLNEVGLTS